MVKRKRPERSEDSKVILVIGAASLDRLLTIPHFPDPDAKIRSTDYNEVGGGNAANSASAIARLVDAKCWESEKKVIVKILTKIGNDEVGKSVIEQLQNSNVDISSPMFKIGSEGSTTSVCTILVDSKAHTRTCIFTLGTCGELSLEDVQSVDLDAIFKNVIHLHSDARHTDAALALAQEAKKRGIPVSLDCEKDRMNPSFDKLLEISDIVFTNSSCLELYLRRLEAELLLKTNRPPLGQLDASRNGEDIENDDETSQIYIKSLIPNAFLSRWYPNKNRQFIVTHGSMGAFHFQLFDARDEIKKGHDISRNTLLMKDTPHGGFHMKHIYSDSSDRNRSDEYDVHKVGVLKNVHIIDTTGAGDAFIGAFLLATYNGLGGDDGVQDALEFATWVSGKKLEGVGAQSALPRGADVDHQLGVHLKEVMENLHRLVGREFNSNNKDCKP